MQRTTRSSILCLTALCAVLIVSSAEGAVVVHTDVLGVQTVTFRDYNGTSDTNVSYNAPAPTQVVGGGVSQWTYGAAGGDPQIRYNDGAGTYDNTVYPYVRLRYKQSTAAAGNVQVWENPAQGGEGPQFGASTSFVEGHADPNTTIGPPLTSNGSGYRIDPFSSAAAGRSLSLDYVMIDRFETIGLGEWDAAGDLQGWGTGNISGVTVANSLLSGTGSNNGDAQIASSPGFDADLYKYIIVSTMNSGSGQELFWGPNGAYAGTRRVGLGSGDGQFHTYLLDFTNESTWTGSNMKVRFDPVTSVGATFGVDYIRASTGFYVPEPTTLLIWSLLAGLGVVAGRRRRRR